MSMECMSNPFFFLLSGHLKKKKNLTDPYSVSFFSIRVVLLNYREDGITPYVTIWKYGLIEEKV